VRVWALNASALARAAAPAPALRAAPGAGALVWRLANALRGCGDGGQWACRAGGLTGETNAALRALAGAGCAGGQDGSPAAFALPLAPFDRLPACGRSNDDWHPSGTCLVLWVWALADRAAARRDGRAMPAWDEGEPWEAA